MNTKNIGNIGEAGVLYKFVELNIPIYIQFGDNEPADYIILVDNKPIKIQVKTSSAYDCHITTFDLVSSTTHRIHGKKHKYSTEEVDAFVCYDLITKECFLVKNHGNMTGFTVRYNKPKNLQYKNINFCKDFILSVETLHELSISLDKDKVQTTI